uniref:Mitochondrial protein n=1 Tax=Lactuca sativa TaxID=4236 RepID=A0A9R1XM35_LACSA|nr:hypothetical protein LSAT_V11C400193810 [Lactuca sativa]
MSRIAPTVSHFQGVKHILLYVKGSFSFGLHFTKPNTSSIIGYLDTNWARCVETRRSTYGYCLYSTLFASHDPKGFNSATRNPKWMFEMHEEMDAHRQNETWSLVPRPQSGNVVGSKWVFRTK